MNRFIGKNSTFLILLNLVLVFALAACSTDQPAPSPDQGNSISQTSPEAKEFPVVTLRHWKDSTPNERYAFLIGFVTMLELEKEWQLRQGVELMPFELSLVASWADAFASRPLSEIYDGINRHILEHPGDMDRPAAEVMWFQFVQPLRDQALAPRQEEALDPEGLVDDHNDMSQAHDGLNEPGDAPANIE